jgi:hypothetical protein
MYTNNRRNRREMAKRFGLFKNQDALTPEDIKNGVTKYQKASRRRERARLAGEQIHLQHLEMVYANQAKAQEELDVRILNNLVDGYINQGMSTEDAEKRAIKERKVEKESDLRRESIRGDEKAIRKELKNNRSTKREIKEALREYRRGLK